MATTIKAVARRAGVSIATVSYVLNNGPRPVSAATRARVERIIQELDFHPHAGARSLPRRRTGVVTLALPWPGEIIFSDPFFPDMLSGVSEVCAVRGYTLSLVTGRTSHKPDLRPLLQPLLSGRRTDGLLISLLDPETETWLGQFLDGPTPFVILGAPVHTSSLRHVAMDTENGTRRATEYLLGMGHTRIGYVGSLHDRPAGMRRLQGYRKALEAANLPFDSELVAEALFTRSGGEEATATLLGRRPRPTAVVVGHDVMTLGALRAIRAAQLRVPGDVSLIGFDLPFADALEPPLTAISLPARESGRRAAELLLDVIEGHPTAAEQPLIPIDLIIRGSAAPPRTAH